VDEAQAETGPGAAAGDLAGEAEAGIPAGEGPGAAEILAELRELRECFDSKIRYDQAKERQIDVLHEELQGYRQGLYQQIMMPVMADLISIYDEAAGLVNGLPPASAESVAFLVETVEMVLERYEVTRFTCEGDAIDRSRQKVIDTEPTAAAELAKRLARRVRPGFEVKVPGPEMKGKVIRPEWVVAYRHVPEPESLQAAED
jgi:molecular chaperone GrpE (heat shock protein)